jgi:hypothetical protein
MDNQPKDKIFEEEKAGVYRPIVGHDKRLTLKPMTMSTAEAFDLLRTRYRGVLAQDRAYLLWLHGKISDEQYKKLDIPEEFAPDLDFKSYKTALCKLIFVGFPDDAKDLNLKTIDRAEQDFLS